MNLDYQVNIADPSFGPCDTPANTRATFQNGLDYCFGPIAAPHGTAGVTDNKVAMVPNGNFRIDAPLQVKYLHGGRIMGAGRFVSKIENITPDSDVFRTNGCGYCHFEGILLKANGMGRCLDLDWDGSAGGAALQANTFNDMFFQDGGVGVQIGRSGYMGSENKFDNCHWIRNKTAGLLTSNYNALQQSVIGGNFQGCGKAIFVGSGSVPLIIGTGFQQSTLYDIDVQSSAYNSYEIKGCRSESPNFFNSPADIAVAMSGCTHSSPSPGYFINTSGTVDVRACKSVKGNIRVFANIRMSLSTTWIVREDWLEKGPLRSLANGNNMDSLIKIELLEYGPTGKQIRNRLITANGEFDYVVTPVTP